MAFKILNDEEISLLTDEQVECYQKELKIYKQREAFVEKLDSLFTVDSSLDGETTSADISGLIGQYAHGNEPSHHVIHLYNYVNRPWRTQELVDSVYRSQYANNVDCLLYTSPSPRDA